jgi:quaternary ammonium compound-resistance protein SugE
VWTGIGAVSAFGVGIILLGKALNPARLVAVVLIVSGLLLLKLSSPE